MSYRAENPTVNAIETLRPAMSVKTSPGAGRFDFVDAGVTPVMAWLSVRLFTANRMRDCENFPALPNV
jgi:hypothetical protein